MIELREKFHWVLYSNFLVTRVEMSGARVVHGLGWVGLGQSADGLGWIGSHKMDNSKRSHQLSHVWGKLLLTDAY